MKLAQLDVGHHYAIRRGGWKIARKALLIEKFVALSGSTRKGATRQNTTGARIQYDGQSEFEVVSTRAFVSKWEEYTPPAQPTPKPRPIGELPPERMNGSRIAALSAYCDIEGRNAGAFVAYRDGRVFLLQGNTWLPVAPLPK